MFTALALLNMLIFPMNALPWVVTGCLEALVSLTRLRRLLLFARDAPSPVPLSAGDDRRGGALLLDARGSFAFPACLEEDSALALEGTAPPTTINGATCAALLAASSRSRRCSYRALGVKPSQS